MLSKLSDKDYEALKELNNADTDKNSGDPVLTKHKDQIDGLLKKGFLKIVRTEGESPFWIDLSTYEITSNGRLEMNMYEKDHS